MSGVEGMEGTGELTTPPIEQRFKTNLFDDNIIQKVLMPLMSVIASNYFVAINRVHSSLCASNSTYFSARIVSLLVRPLLTIHTIGFMCLNRLKRSLRNSLKINNYNIFMQMRSQSHWKSESGCDSDDYLISCGKSNAKALTGRQLCQWLGSGSAVAQHWAPSLLRRALKDQFCCCFRPKISLILVVFRTKHLPLICYSRETNLLNTFELDIDNNRKTFTESLSL